MNKFIYWEDSWNTISKEDHIKRGSCCGNTCKECPYLEVKKGNTKIKK